MQCSQLDHLTWPTASAIAWSACCKQVTTSSGHCTLPNSKSAWEASTKLVACRFGGTPQSCHTCNGTASPAGAATGCWWLLAAEDGLPGWLSCMIKQLVFCVCCCMQDVGACRMLEMPGALSSGQTTLLLLTCLVCVCVAETCCQSVE